MEMRWIQRNIYLCVLIFLAVYSFSISASSPKLSPLLQKAFQEEISGFSGFAKGQYGISYSNDSKLIYHLLVKTTADKKELITARFPVQTLSGGVATLTANKEMILSLAQRKDIYSIELSAYRPPLLDISTQSGFTTLSNQTTWLGIGARYLQSQGHTGKGVVIGDVDTGIDYTHGDFLSSPSTSRILYIWDQTDDTTGSHPADCDYGREYTNADINEQFLHPDTTSVNQQDTNYHGTAVMGVAAGNGQGTGNGIPARTYSGVAPEASIIMVKTDFYDSHIIDGINYIFNRASSLNIPAVVNLSLGSHYGPHDGTSAFETAIDSSLGPGRMLVAAAGNNGAARVHAKFTIPAFSWDTLLISIPAGYPDIDLDLWHDGKDKYDCIMKTPSGNSLSCLPYTQASSSLGGGNAQLFNQVNSPSNGDGEIFLTLSSLTEFGEWKLLFFREADSIGTGVIDAWSANEKALFNNHAIYQGTVIEPGHAKRVLTVGAYATRNTWSALDGSTYSYPSILLGQRSGFSSIGPSRDNTLKPEICAPGQNIATAQSSFAANKSQLNVIMTDGKHRICSGTSFASPHGAGVVALLLQENPIASPEEIKAQITQCAYRDDYYTGTVPDMNYRWGYGKLNLRGIIPTGVVSRYWQMLD
jgi:subtilisin family serine protease